MLEKKIECWKKINVGKKMNIQFFEWKKLCVIYFFMALYFNEIALEIFHKNLFMTDFLLSELIDAKNEIENSFQNLNNLKDKVEKLEKKLNKADTRNDDQNTINDDPNNSQSETQSELNNLKVKIGNLESRIQALEQGNLSQHFLKPLPFKLVQSSEGTEKIFSCFEKSFLNVENGYLVPKFDHAKKTSLDDFDRVSDEDEFGEDEDPDFL